MPNPYSHQNTLNSTIFAAWMSTPALRHPSSNDRNQSAGDGNEIRIQADEVRVSAEFHAARQWSEGRPRSAFC
jgi:hypothetical protein